MARQAGFKPAPTTNPRFQFVGARFPRPFYAGRETRPLRDDPQQRFLLVLSLSKGADGPIHFSRANEAIIYPTQALIPHQMIQFRSIDQNTSIQ